MSDFRFIGNGSEALRSSMLQRLRDGLAARKRVILAVFLAIVIVIALIVTEAARCGSDFVIMEYEFKLDGIDGDLRIAMLSDLHESEFGKDNDRLIKAVERLSPHIILCVGDMVTRDVEEGKVHIGVDVIRAMTEIAPTYVSLGNHETEYVRKNGTELLTAYEEAGAHLLDNEYVELELCGMSIRLGGVSDFCYRNDETDEEFLSSRIYAFMSDFCDTDSYKILMCHRPEAYRLEKLADDFVDWDCDIVLSGHTHGGLVQIPGIGSPFLPSQGFFPKYDKGLFDVGNADMIVGGGLGTGTLFRLFNPCELVKIKIAPKSEG